MVFRRPVASGGKRLRWTLIELMLALTLMGLGGWSLVGCSAQTVTEDSSTSSTASAITGRTAPAGETTDATMRAGTTMAAGDAMASPAQSVATKLGPSVVNIAVRGTVQGLFGQQQSYSGEGSGVIYTNDGKIITNNHVVTDDYGGVVRDLEVTLATGQKLAAGVIGRDALTDLAVIKVDASMDLPAATFRNDQPSVGEYAVAIGSPLGYENSVTLGVVSGLARSIEGVSGPEGVALNNLIQTDAPISPGNSGGALANANGEVIGINVAYLPAQTGAVNIGFAIPSVVATQVADEIIKTGKATHSYLGVGPQTVTTELQRRFGLSRSSGVLVAEVTLNGPADKAGIKRGDIIFKIGDREMVTSSDLLVAIRDKKPGDRVQVTLDRDGRTSTVTVTLQERPSE
ncbi:MAG: S1C family serine protease [Thermoleophilia bacterium]|jgi:S1-C subfamily serine protease